MDSSKIELQNVCLSHIWNLQTVNTLIPDDKYSRRYMQIFLKQLQTPLSQKAMAFFRFFIEFLKSAWNLKHSEKKRVS